MRRTAFVMVIGSAAALLAMVVVALATGATQEAHEYVADPAAYARALTAHPGGTRLIFAFDIAFIVFYTAFFAALAAYLKLLGRPFTRLALGLLLATTVLDVIEDHHILALLDSIENGLPVDAGALVFQQVLSATKFTLSYVALFLFGLAIPRTSWIAWALSLFLTAGTLATGVLGYAAPPAWRAQLDGGRWIGFLVGFTLAAVWLHRAPEPASRARTE